MSLLTTSNISQNNSNRNSSISTKTTYTTTPASTGTQLTIPNGTTSVTIKIWGAGGGVTNTGGSSGSGGYTTIQFVPNPAIQYWISVGRQGISGVPTGGSIMAGGFGSVSGGDASLLAEFYNSTYTLLAVAGGGGSGNNGGVGGAGGGSSGVTGGGGGGGGSGGTGGLGTVNGTSATLTSSTMTGFGGGGAASTTGGGGGYGGGGAVTVSAGGGGGYAGTSTTNTTVVTSSTTAGSGTTPPNTSDSDYVNGIATGGSGASASGGNGYIVVYYYTYNVVSLGITSYTDKTSAASTTSAQFSNINIVPPTLNALNTGNTITNAINCYIGGAPYAGTNTTITNAYALYVNRGTSLFGGTLTIAGGVNSSGSSNIDLSGNSGIFTSPTGQFKISNSSVNFSANNNTVGNIFQISAFGQTYTDTSATAPVSNMAFNSIGASTLASSITKTTTNAYNLYMRGAVIQGTNQTITNTYNLFIDNVGNTNASVTEAASLAISGAPAVSSGSTYSLLVKGGNSYFNGFINNAYSQVIIRNGSNFGAPATTNNGTVAGSSFTLNGGRLIVRLNFSGLTSVAGGFTITFSIATSVSATPLTASSGTRTITAFLNATNTHFTFPVVVYTVASGYTPGTYLGYIKLAVNTNFSSDSNDPWSFTIEELPIS